MSCRRSDTTEPRLMVHMKAYAPILLEILFNFQALLSQGVLPGGSAGFDVVNLTPTHSVF